jgi:hypothetical protein
MSKRMTRVLGLSLASVIMMSCVSAPVSISPNPNWKRVSGEEAGCVSFSSRRRETVDVNIILEPGFERTLVAQLKEADRNAASLCWYETPAGTIRLFAGSFCAGGTDAFFEPRDGAWKLTNTSMVWITCKPDPQ